MHDISGEVLCGRWIENPCNELFCGEGLFQHKLPFDRSSMTRWRQRMGEEKLVAPLRESLSVAVRADAAKAADFANVNIDTTAAKGGCIPDRCRLMHRVLVRPARKHGVRLSQSYVRVGKTTAMKHQRCVHPIQFKRTKWMLWQLRTSLGRVGRDIGRRLPVTIWLRPLCGSSGTVPAQSPISLLRFLE